MKSSKAKKRETSKLEGPESQTVQRREGGEGEDEKAASATGA